MQLRKLLPFFLFAWLMCSCMPPAYGVRVIIKPGDDTIEDEVRIAVIRLVLTKHLANEQTGLNLVAFASPVIELDEGMLTEQIDHRSYFGPSGDGKITHAVGHFLYHALHPLTSDGTEDYDINHEDRQFWHDLDDTPVHERQAL